MLEELSIKDFILISSQTLRFSEHLNVISGETGSGKSVILSALSLVLGGKASKKMVREGKNSSSVSAIFRLQSGGDAERWARDHGFEPDEGVYFVRRVIEKSGASRAYIQGQPVLAADLSVWGQLLFDVHLQYESRLLVSQSYQREVLDRAGELGKLTGQVQTLFKELSDLLARSKKARASLNELEESEEYLRYAVSEIKDAQLHAGEEEELQELRLSVSHEKERADLERSISEKIISSSSGALPLLRSSLSDVAQLAALDQTLSDFSEKMASLYYDLEDLVEGYEGRRKELEAGRVDPEAMAERLSVIASLKRKYGGSYDAVLDFFEKAEKDLASLDELRENSCALEAQVQKKRASLEKVSLELSRARSEAGEPLKEKIEERLNALGFKNASFSVAVTQQKNKSGELELTASGVDEVEFLFSGNLGQPFQPLRFVASGGELSRVLLAVKSLLVSAETVESLLFDEIDTGIGGAVAVAVGDHLLRLSSVKQVLCITHLASIASYGQVHFGVSKAVDKEAGVTLTHVRALEGEDRIKEIERMLSGESFGAASYEHARSLLERAQESYGKPERKTTKGSFKPS